VTHETFLVYPGLHVLFVTRASVLARGGRRHRHHSYRTRTTAVRRS